MSYKAPFINAWNPICKRYQWLRIVNVFSFNKGLSERSMRAKGARR